MAVVGVVVVVLAEVEPGKAPLASRQLRTDASCAAVSGGGVVVLVIVCPPVVTVSVTVGTVPDSCSACRDRAGTAVWTPLILATSDAATCGNVMSVPGTKKS